MLADDIGIVDVLTRMEFKKIVVVDIIIEPLGTHAHTGNNFTPVDGFFGAGNGPALDKVD